MVPNEFLTLEKEKALDPYSGANRAITHYQVRRLQECNRPTDGHAVPIPLGKAIAEVLVDRL